MGNSGDLNLVENYPSNNITGFMVMNMNPEFINAMVQYMEMGGMADASITQMMGANFTLQDLLKAFKGDFAVVVSDFSVPKTDSAMGNKMKMRPSSSMIFNAAIGDRNQLNKLLDNLVQKQLMVKDNNGYSLSAALSQSGWKVSIDDKNMIISTNEKLLSSYKAKSVKANLSNDVTKDLSGKTASMYINIEALLNGFPSATTSSNSSSIATARETFKDCKGYVTPFKGKTFEGHFELRMKNEKENSLTSLLKMAESVSKNIKTKQRGDSLGVPMTVR